MILTARQTSALDEREVEADEAIIEQGTPGAKVFVLVESAVAVHSGGDKITEIDTAGTVFGETSTLLGRNHSATVTTEIASRFYVIDDLPTFIRQNPESALTFMQHDGRPRRVDERSRRRQWVTKRARNSHQAVAT